MHDKRIELLAQALTTSGLDDATRFLNATVDHRFTAIYALKGGERINVGFSDKTEKVQGRQLQPAALRTSLSPFILEDSGEPERKMYQHCAPVTDAQDKLLGTLCHFDFVRHELPDEEFAFLRLAARAVAAYMPNRA